MLQSEALEILKMGKNVFLTGPAGSGKTYLLNQYISFLKEKSVPVGVTASTGIAATHMNGVTIHSWSGLGIKDKLSALDVDSLLEKSYLKKRFKYTQVLIIDEISMLHSFQLDAIDIICRAFKHNDFPFGGMQVILCGDFFQLPPINKADGEMNFAYKSSIWTDMDLNICYLEEQYRQEEGDSLLRILNEIRDNKVGENTWESLKERQKYSEFKFTPTKLYTHNRDVDSLNLQELDKITAPLVSYKMKDTGTKRLVDGLKKSCLAQEELRLKKGAVVMFIKNNFEKGYVNGTLGTIIDFNNGQPVVETYSGKEILVEDEFWHIEEEGKQKAKIIQIPLRLAWAITIHKSQGMSLDLAEIDLSKSFVAGMGYVALSRVRSLDGLYLKGINNTALQVNDEILDFDLELKKESERAVFCLKSERNIKEVQKDFVEVSAVENYKEEKISTFDITKKMVLQEMMIEDIARERNLTISTIVSHLEKLAEEKGGGKVNFEYIKDDLLNFDEILKVWKKVGGDKLSPIKKALPDNISWEDIRLVKLFI
ncbi:MAG: helix-turn-helix domain-containing protein [Candidatus Pacebacteria bacterium]|nr:helix-turn-helix domain-containing protein [Candidatus Paceibacterota bacterium]